MANVTYSGIASFIAMQPTTVASYIGVDTFHQIVSREAKNKQAIYDKQVRKSFTNSIPL